MDILCYPFARGRLFLEQEIDNNQYDDDAPFLGIWYCDHG